MAAGIADRFTNASNGTRPTPTTLNALLASGASPGTANCAALTGWPTGTAVHFVIYNIDSNGKKVAGSQTDWKAIVSGATLTSMTLKAGTNSGYSVGAVVEAAPTAAWADDMATGLQAEHKQTGAHSAVTADSVVSAGDITDNANTVARVVRDETMFDHTVPGNGVWSGDSYASTRNASMTAWAGYIDGYRLTINAVAARAFTASKDTYIDVLRAGTTASLVYTEVANNAASPALAANSIRIGIIVTGASNIAAATSVNQGDPNAILPVVSSNFLGITDSLGNLIYNCTPNPTIIGYRQITTDFASAATGGNVDVTGLDQIKFIVPAGRNVEMHGFGQRIMTGAVGNNVSAQLFESATQLSEADNSTGSNINAQIFPERVYRFTAGLHTVKATIGQGSNAGTMRWGAAAAYPGYVAVRLV